MIWLLLTGCVGGVATVDADGDGVPASLDCNDANVTVHPGAEEVWYDGIDQDCDGADDFDRDGDGLRSRGFGGDDCDDDDAGIGGDPQTWYPDCDGDGFASGTPIEAACGQPTAAESAGYCVLGQPLALLDDAGQEDCNDSTPRAYPGRSLDPPYDGIDGDCDGANDFDADGDGFVAIGFNDHASGLGTGDCDDTDPLVFPGAADLPTDGLDADCDGVFELDRDGDGYVEGPFRAGLPGGDCNDDDPTVSPGRAELLCDGIDNDCRSATSDGPDADGDGFTCATDCDDGDAAVFPGAPEACDDVDQNCDGNADGDLRELLFLDLDRDGFGRDVTVLTCPTPNHTALGGDCDDTLASRNPGAEEVCDGLDNDCDGQRDEGLPTTDVFLDTDGDGVGGQVAAALCAPLPVHVTVGGDCDDNDPEAVAPRPFFVDCDGDGAVGDLAEDFCRRADAVAHFAHVCGPARRVSESAGGDCADDDPTRSPLQAETCEAIDRNCDGRPFDGLTTHLDADGDGFGAATLVPGCDGADNALDQCDDAPGLFRNHAAFPPDDPDRPRIPAGSDLGEVLATTCPDATLYLDDGVFQLTADLDVTDLSLIGASSGARTVLQGADQYGVRTTGAVTLASLDIVQGAGAIVNTGVLTLSDSLLQGHADTGAGLHNDGATLHGTNVRFVGNGGAEALRVQGGSASCTDCVFRDNRGADGPSEAAALRVSSADLTLVRAVFEGNGPATTPALRAANSTLHLEDATVARAPCPTVDDCTGGVTTDGGVVTVVGGSTDGWVSIGGDVSLTGHTVQSGSLGLIVADAVVVHDVHVVDGFARVMASEGAHVSNVRIAGDEGLSLVNLGSAPFVADQITTTNYTTCGLGLSGFGPFDVSDVIGGYGVGPVLQGSVPGASIRFVFAAGGADLGSVPCTDCAVVGDVLVDPPVDVNLVDASGVVGSGEGCGGAAAICRQPGYFGGP